MCLCNSIHRWPMLCTLLYLFLSLVQCQQQQAPLGASASILQPIIIPNLPTRHYQFWFKSHQLAYERFVQICSKLPKHIDKINSQEFTNLHINVSLEDSRYLSDLDYGKSRLLQICSTIDDATKSCWGYENNCASIYLMPECSEPGSDPASENSKNDEKINWFNQADFGYILNLRKDLRRYCSPDKQLDPSTVSSFDCSKNFEFCRGNNLFMNLENAEQQNTSGKEPFHFKKDDIGGWNCDLQEKRLDADAMKAGEHQNWRNAFRNYSRDDNLKEFCDEKINKPVFFIKIDLVKNMYEHFSHFINLYATIHLNNRFSEDNYVILWDNASPKYKYDEMWTVFSKHQLKNIGQFKGKRVCFNKMISVLLSKEKNSFYYNGLLKSSKCRKTGLVDAFNKHVLHKFGISSDYNLTRFQEDQNKQMRIMILTKDMKINQISNLHQLISNISLVEDYHVELINEDEKGFKEMLQILQNTDILLGLHDPILTYTLFLPDWASLFVLNNLDTKFYNLAKIRGINYYPEPNRKGLVHEQIESGTNSTLKLDDKRFFKYLEKISGEVRSNRDKYFKRFLSEKSFDAETQRNSKPKTSRDEL